MMTRTEGQTQIAPAKVNLCLHVTGRRADGYHLLDSLVVFAGVGDRISLRPAEGAPLRITGPFADGLSAGPDNLVLRAARALAPDLDLGFDLEKNLPVASGIGGGSADAAAALRLVAAVCGRVPDAALLQALGADVPVCYHGAPARMRGIGEDVLPMPALPPVWLVLVNPGVPVSTPAVFRALSRSDNAPLPPLPRLWRDARELAEWLQATRNDLEGPALDLAPPVARALGLIAQTPDCLLARMSGSGATCLGFFASRAAADAAAAGIARAAPEWWVAAAPVLD